MNLAAFKTRQRSTLFSDLFTLHELRIRLHYNLVRNGTISKTKNIDDVSELLSTIVCHVVDHVRLVLTRSISLSIPPKKISPVPTSLFYSAAELISACESICAGSDSGSSGDS